MSHKLFRHSILSHARVWDFLTQVDAAEVAACRAVGCPRCGGALHSATYPRKPRGLAAALRDDVRRFSLCCAVCLRRVQPPSVRFFGRRFYVGGLFLLVSALSLSGGVRLQTIARRYGTPVITLKRWRRWWQEAFPQSRAWRVKRGELAAPPGRPPLRRLLHVMRGRRFRPRLLRSLVRQGSVEHATRGGWRIDDDDGARRPSPATGPGPPPATTPTGTAAHDGIPTPSGSPTPNGRWSDRPPPGRA